MPEGMPEDQASSLRRLLGGAALRSALFIGGDAGIGQTALVAAVADAMARLGRSVLVVDAQPQLRSGAGWFGLLPRGDLADALLGHCRPDDVLLHAAGGVSWVPAARLGPAAGLPLDGGRAEQAAARAIAEFSARYDCVLLDVPSDRADRWWPAAGWAGTVLVGSTGSQRSVTHAYSALKMLALEVGQQRYLWWIARASAAADAEEAWRKVAQTARRFLQVQVGYAGAVPIDPAVPRAGRLRRPLASVFPGSGVAALAAALAARLDAVAPPPVPAEDAWRGLLVGGMPYGTDPAQNRAGGRTHAPEAGTGPVRLRDAALEPLPAARNPSRVGAPGRSALVSR